MSEENVIPPSRDEARAALADVGRIVAETQVAIARGPSAQLLILWGLIWFVANTTIQFYPSLMRWIWWVLDAVGLSASMWLIARHRVQVKRPGAWRMGAFWGTLILYAMLWMLLLMPPALLEKAGNSGVSDPAFRSLCTYWHTIPMFGYVVIGLWLGRFFIWLGLLVTVLVMAGYWFAGNYLFLWLGIVGGGALIGSGVFIRKFWK